jgi:flavodoxin
MKEVLIIYDSVFGNTKKISEAMFNALEPKMEVDLCVIGEVFPEHLDGVKYLLIGSPTRQFKETTAMNQFLKQTPKNGLNGIKYAAFDTRMTPDDVNKNRLLGLMVRLFGYAAEKISKQLRLLGGVEAVRPEGFYVVGMEGPLAEGVLDRAAKWAMDAVISG